MIILIQTVNIVDVIKIFLQELLYQLQEDLMYYKYLYTNPSKYLNESDKKESLELMKKLILK